MADLELPRLPDNRSTQRLINVLSQLEEHLANAAVVGANAKASQSPAPVGAQINGEISRLRQQLKQERNRKREACDRLDDLIARVQSQAAENAKQEHAA